MWAGSRWCVPLGSPHAHTAVVLVVLFGDPVHSLLLWISGYKRTTCQIGENQKQVAVAAQMALSCCRSPRGFVKAAKWTCYLQALVSVGWGPACVKSTSWGQDPAGRAGNFLSQTCKTRHLTCKCHWLLSVPFKCGKHREAKFMPLLVNSTQTNTILSKPTSALQHRLSLNLAESIAKPILLLKIYSGWRTFSPRILIWKVA